MARGPRDYGGTNAKHTALPLLVAALPLLAAAVGCAAGHGDGSSSGTQALNAAQCASATPWATWTAYSVGQLVTYSGTTYECIQAHTSEPGWSPDVVAALWEPVQCAGGGSSSSGSSSSGGTSGGTTCPGGSSSGGSSGSGSGSSGGGSSSGGTGNRRRPSSSVPTRTPAST